MAPSRSITGRIHANIVTTLLTVDAAVITPAKATLSLEARGHPGQLLAEDMAKIVASPLNRVRRPPQQSPQFPTVDR